MRLGLGSVVVAVVVGVGAAVVSVGDDALKDGSRGL